MYSLISLLSYLLGPIVLAEGILGISTEGEVVEYCQSEVFKPQCLEDEVVVMQTARYGHIKIGKCIDVDVGHLGCYVDQLSVMDRMCSGKETCEVAYSDSLMVGEFPCMLRKSFVRYLEASFICQTVYIPQTGKCLNSEVGATSRMSYISSGVTEKFGCGVQNRPWVITAKEGQKINVSFTDFNWKLRSRSDATVPCPQKYGYIVDELTNDVVNLCGGLVRERNIYISKGHKLQILFTSSMLQDVQFLIGYKAEGCPTYKALPDTWTEEKDGYIIVGCINTKEQWRMRCIGTHWLGPLRDCSAQRSKEQKLKSAKSQPEGRTVLSMPPAVAFAVIGGLALVFVSIIATTIIGIFCIRKSEGTGSDHFKLRKGNNIMPPVAVPLDNFPTYKSVQVKLPKRKEAALNTAENPFDSINTLPSVGSIPRHPPSIRESPHYYLLEGRDTTETEPLYDVVYQGLPTQDLA